MDNPLDKMLSKRRDRGIATILGLKEREADKYLPPEVQTKLRKVILDQINELTDFMLDIVQSYNQGDIILNELWVQKLDEIHAAVVESNGHR